MTVRRSTTQRYNITDDPRLAKIRQKQPTATIKHTTEAKTRRSRPYCAVGRFGKHDHIITIYYYYCYYYTIIIAPALQFYSSVIIILLLLRGGGFGFQCIKNIIVVLQ